MLPAVSIRRIAERRRGRRSPAASGRRGEVTTAGASGRREARAGGGGVLGVGAGEQEFGCGRAGVGGVWHYGDSLRQD